MKKSFFMLLILFICGVLSADICIESIGDSTVLLDIGTYVKYASAKLVFKDVFWSILYERVKLFLILILLCFTPIKERISIILISLFSFIWGFFCMSCILELGLAGVVIGIASVLPHGLLYGGILLIVLQKKRAHSYHQRDNRMLRVSSYLFIILFFITGCVVESLISTHFIPWVIRLSMI